MPDGVLSDYANYYRYIQGQGGSPAPTAGASAGLTAGDIAAAALAESGLNPDGSPMGGVPAEEKGPLEWAAMSISQRTSMLPAWARDLKILGLGAMDTPEPFVYMNEFRVPGTPENPTQFDTPQGFREGNDMEAPATTDKAQSITRAKNLPYLWDEDEVDAAMKRMQDAGLDVTSFDSLTAKWNALVDRASTTYMLSEGEKKLTPWDVLDLIQREDESANGGEAAGNFTHVSTSKSIQDISEGEAWATLQSNLSRMLGRDPSDQEVRDFTHRMNGLAARNPSISRTVATYKDGRLTNSTTREVDSGFTADDMAMTSYEDAQADPEYGAFQAASTYFNATQQALGAIGDV